MRAPFLIPAAALLLSGCAAVADLDRALSARFNPQPAPPAVATVPAAPLPDRKPPAPRQAVAARPAPADRTPPKPEPPPAEVEQAPAALVPQARSVPATLVGLAADDLRTIMGAPAQEIAEAPGVRWRYRGPGCILDVHLFPRVESQGLYALDVSAVGLPVEECLERFRNPPPPAAPEPAERDGEPAGRR